MAYFQGMHFAHKKAQTQKLSSLFSGNCLVADSAFSTVKEKVRTINCITNKMPVRKGYKSMPVRKGCTNAKVHILTGL